MQRPELASRHAKRQVRVALRTAGTGKVARAARRDAVSPQQAPEGTPVHRSLQELQRRHGNRYVGQLLRHASSTSDGERTRLIEGTRSIERMRDGSPKTLLQRADDVHHQSMDDTTDTGNKYTQQLDVNKTARHVQIQLGINWAKQGNWASDLALQLFIRKVKIGVYGYLDNKFKIICTPPAIAGGAAAAIELRIDFLLYDDPSGYKIDSFGGQHGRSQMTQGGGQLFELGQDSETELPAVTSAHEFGHALLGASDEYTNAAVPGRTISNDHSIMGDFYSQGTAAAEFKVRHFQNILTTVAAQYPGYACKLAPV